MTAAPRLHLISTEPPPPRRLAITISAFDRRVPIGRSRTFKLRPESLERLLLEAQRLEARA